MPGHAWEDAGSNKRPAHDPADTSQSHGALMNIARYSLGRPAAHAVALQKMPSYQRRTRGLSDVDHRHTDFDQVLYFASAGVHHMDFQTFDFEAHSVGIIPAGAVHRFASGCSATGFALNVDVSAWPAETDILRIRALALTRAPLRALSSQWKTEPRHLFRMVALEMQTGEHTAVLGGLLATLAALLSRALEADPRSESSGLLGSFLQLVETTFTNPLPLAGYAKRLGVSARSLHQTTDRGLGSSPLQVVQQRRVLEAKRLLLHSGLNVSEIAAALGFADPGYFSRFFRRLAGVPPSQLRASSCVRSRS